MCGNCRTPGQLDQTIDGWPDNFAFPPFVMSLPCPLCHGEGRILRDVWDTMSGGSRKKPKKEKKSKKDSMWDEQQEIRQQQEEDWRKMGEEGQSFDFNSYKKED